MSILATAGPNCTGAPIEQLPPPESPFGGLLVVGVGVAEMVGCGLGVGSGDEVGFGVGEGDGERVGVGVGC
jgi:hypothetical protein